MIETVTSWGRVHHAAQKTIRLRHRHQSLRIEPNARVLPHGLGRSYGDSCLNHDGILLCTRGLDRFIAFNPQTGVLDCEAGVTLQEITALILPQGWFLPVTPGTQFVTLGGAIANDVHGKNHHRAGSFGHHVLSFGLLRSDGIVRCCSSTENAGLFAATVGGLGLTGLILDARLQLRRVPGPWISCETLRFDSLDGFFDLSAESDATYEYTVAWLDCFSRHGRGLFSRGNHAPSPAAVLPSRTLSVPFTPPASLVGNLSVRAFNALYFHRGARRAAPALSHYRPFFYPLDGLRHWNRLYGPRGFYQYQCVLPPSSAREALRELLALIAASGQGSMLAVLKLFGTRASPGLLSFPRPGVTLALDFPNRGESTRELLDRLDTVTRAAGGALYPGKDARMEPSMFRFSFPQTEAFLRYRDPAYDSSMARRLELT